MFKTVLNKEDEDDLSEQEIEDALEEEDYKENEKMAEPEVTGQ